MCRETEYINLLLDWEENPNEIAIYCNLLYYNIMGPLILDKLRLCVHLRQICKQISTSDNGCPTVTLSALDVRILKLSISKIVLQ